MPFITSRKRRLRRLCFHRCLFVHRGVSAPLHTGIHTPHTHPSPGPEADSPLGKHPPGQAPPLQTPPWADTPPADSLWADTLLGRYPPCPVHAGIHTSTQCMLGYTPLRCACWDTVNKRALRIPLECILVIQCYRYEKKSYSGDYFARYVLAELSSLKDI